MTDPEGIKNVTRVLGLSDETGEHYREASVLEPRPLTGILRLVTEEDRRTAAAGDSSSASAIGGVVEDMFEQPVPPENSAA